MRIVRLLTTDIDCRMKKKKKRLYIDPSSFLLRRIRKYWYMQKDSLAGRITKKKEERIY